MPRARNIKPSFFDNDELAENNPLGRLLFIGLWTLADHNGNLEWREKRIKKQLLAYDNCDVKELAINLDKSGFVRFYSDGDSIYINIANFTKHQNPHKNEKLKGTDIPEYCNSMRQAVDLKEITINHDKSGLEQDQSTSDPADSCSMIPDSPILNPDTCVPESSKQDSQTTNVVDEKPKKKRFTPPTQEEVFIYMGEYSKNKGKTISPSEPEKFVSFYESKNWYVGKNKMKDWKGAARNWILNAKDMTPASSVGQNVNAIDHTIPEDFQF